MAVPGTIDGKHRRRKRYIEAIDPLRQRFGCTAAEVSSHVDRTLLANARLSQEIVGLKEDNEYLKSEKERLEVELLDAKALAALVEVGAEALPSAADG